MNYMRKGRKKDRTGERIGTLTVIREAGQNKLNQFYWLCRCDCGKETRVISGNLNNNHTTRCDQNCPLRDCATKHGGARKTGWSPLYKKWKSMISRCANLPKAKLNYRNYFLKNIGIFLDWMPENDGFNNFKSYVSLIHPNYEKLLEKKYQIDRIDNNGNYEPGNIRLTSCKENNRNKSSNRIETAFGITATLAELVEKFGIVKYGTILARLKSGWEIEKALTTKAQKRGK